MTYPKLVHSSIWRKLIFVLFIGLLFQTQVSFAQDAPDLAAGETLFNNNCASCHKVHKKLIGPALFQVDEKYDREWLYRWVKNSQALVKSGDAEAVALFEENNKSVMTAFPALKNADIDNIVAYTNSVPVPVDPVAVVGGDGVSEASSGHTTIFLFLLTAILLTIAFLMTKVLRQLNVMAAEKRGEPIPAAFTLGRFFAAPAVKVILGLLAFVMLCAAVFDNASNIGYQSGYAPEQPIKFSHKLHAGTHGIDCEYCHSGARSGKTAVIPSGNVCMNCHKGIKEGPEYGTKEIGKIYEAMCWDVDTQSYIDDCEKTPLEWIKVHNLPDHVYFNHSQHIVAGKQKCQTCHGAVEEMDVVEQTQELSMGWCIQCHRDTKIQFTNNEYYQIYDKYHEELKNGDRESVTVEDIGGTECQKCHY